MIFNSNEFLPFFAIVYSLYLLARTRFWQNLVLLIASYVFYGYAAPAYVFLLAFYTVVGYATALFVADQTRPWRRGVLSAAVLSNLAVLAYFKYADFFLVQTNTGLEAVGLDVRVPLLGVMLPIGVSFFTFQCIAYMVDVYRGEAAAVRSLLDFAVFKSFFPQLVAGPIERARHMMPQFSSVRRITRARVRNGLYFVVVGYILKSLVADRVASFVDYQFVFSDTFDRSPEAVILAVLAFGIQIYGDFAGYTYIALGLGQLMGIELSRNFLAPYLATDIQDFWRRWHVTLSSWLRDYLYIPLGGSRLGETRTLVNLMITMALGGLWHGASWNFVIWGVFHGAGLIVHRLTRGLRDALPMGVRTYGGWLLTFTFVMAGWGIFRAHSFSDLTNLARAVATVNPILLLSDPRTWALLALLALVMTVQHLEEQSADRPWIESLSGHWRAAFYAAGVAALVAVGFGSHRFIYFQF